MTAGAFGVSGTTTLLGFSEFIGFDFFCGLPSGQKLAQSFERFGLVKMGANRALEFFIRPGRYGKDSCHRLWQFFEDAVTLRKRLRHSTWDVVC